MKPDPTRLLLVDDDANNLDMLSRRLIRQGYSVEVAPDGPSALEKLRQAEYDLILLDQMMPGMSGLDLLRLLRATYSPSELPVIMVTAVDQPHTVVEALDHGANDYVVKPVDMPIITARIEAQLSRSKAEKKLKVSDLLTGLSNRPLLLDRMAQALVRLHTGEQILPALLLLDLDGFKVINDSFGHDNGDQLLIQVAKRLTGLLNGQNIGPVTVSRVGGDEFAVLLENPETLDHIREFAGRVLAAISRSVVIEGLPVAVSASAGVALASFDHPAAEAWLRDADLAMYRAKELGKNRWFMFEIGLRDRAQQRMAVAIDLRGALERDELLVYYQPKFTLATRAIIGFESLLRWQHRERGLLSPAEFISVAEETGLIIPIGHWILDMACRQLKVWQTKFPCSPPLNMNVNLSVRQLADPKLVSHVRTILAQSGILPGTLKLELTESCLMTEVESAEEVLADLKALQVGLKLDDFGTGYSSLSYLRAIHFDSLKIDRSFVKRLSTDSDGAAIVETIVNLAHLLHMNVVAEGIEDEDQLAQLINLGCEMGQGFYFSAPVDAETAERLLVAQFSTPAQP